MSIFRSIVENILQEMTYPSNFDLQYFSTIPTFKDRIKYCKDRLKLIGNGTSRIAFQVDDKKVLKIAKNSKGIAQNIKEEDWGRNQYGCFAKIYEADTNNHTWIEMELASKVTFKNFIEHFGLSAKSLLPVFEYVYNTYTDINKNNKLPEKEQIEEFLKNNIYNKKNKELYNLYQYILDYQPDKLTIKDWCRSDNWGKVNRNGKEYYVIIDDGFDEDIWNKYYA